MQSGRATHFRVWQLCKRLAAAPIITYLKYMVLLVLYWYGMVTTVLVLVEVGRHWPMFVILALFLTEHVLVIGHRSSTSTHSPWDSVG
jgi:hypothetical protein